MTVSLDDIRAAANLPAAMFNAAEHHAGRPAQWRRDTQGYVPISYAQLADRVRHVACGLVQAGVASGDRVALLMENRPEWAVIDYAVLAIGAVSVPLYTSYRPQDIAYVINDAEASTAITSGGKLLRHLLEAVKDCPKVKGVYALEPGGEQGVNPFAELEAAAVDTLMLAKRLDKVGRDTLATLVYTSGTTGNPKGVMLTHGNILANLEAIDFIRFYDTDRMLSILPLAHSFERTAGHFLPYSIGISVAFAERPDTVAKNLPEAQPTILVAVPRLFEVLRSRILAQVAKQSAVHEGLFTAYMRLAERYRCGGTGPAVVFHLLDRLVGAKVRGRFGGRLRLMVSGGAPLNVEVAEFFERLGLPILEGYGMTEAAPVISANPEADRRFGTVGRPLRGVAVKIADDGEILVKGANVMPGYWKLKKETKATLADGWLHTGDIGEIDNDGYLRITDRKKDIIVNSGGENIAPQRIESLLVADDLIEQVVVFGDQRPYLVAMVVPNEEACIAWAKQEGLPEAGWKHLAASSILRKALQTRINGHLKSLAQHEQVRRILVRPEPFTIEEGLLTPTLKIKRRPVYERYKDAIEALY